MFNRKSTGRFSVLLLAFVLLFVAAIPAWAADSSSPAIDIRLKLGSKQMTVNGTASTVQPPFQKNGATYIPLSVLTKGLGAKLALTQNKILTLTLGSHKLVLTLGGKTATADGKATALQAAPLLQSGVTMVPLQVVQYLGATKSFTAATKEIRVTLANVASGSGSTGGTSAIDSDAGKSKIGDSYYKWSMNYPTGLVQDYQSTDGDALEFRDVKKEYFLGVYVYPQIDQLTASEVRDTIYSLYYNTETTVTKTTETRAGATYESVITKDKNGLYYEYRGFQANDFLYIVAYGKKASSASELKQSTTILDSFKTSFNSADSKLKDLTQIVAGYKTFKYEDYGLSLQLPKEWELAKDSNYPYYQPKDESAYVYVDVTSLVKGDTVDAWIDRKMSSFKDTFDTPYYKVLEKTNVEWNGKPAVMQKLSYSYDTKNWWEEYEIFAVEGDYRYYTEFAYLQNRKAEFEPILGQVLKSLRVDYGEVEDNFGEIVDDSDIVDRTAVTTKTSRKYGYSIALPQQWSGVKNDFENDEVSYAFNGGSLLIDILEGVTDAQQLYESANSSFAKADAESNAIRVTENSMTTFGGLTAKKLVLEDDGSEGGGSTRTTLYVVVSNNRGYLVATTLSTAFASAFNKKQLDDAVKSFKFN
ncbi:stalk domain-containing protein [Cohnella sp. GCM10012308]|uniref:stalk domain-containing protein n=1 Tax=Cohnella sp. GCM10012308 TaxID=3317329 RepID=UPI003607F867